jgi:hypothetical protein
MTPLPRSGMFESDAQRIPKLPVVPFSSAAMQTPLAALPATRIDTIAVITKARTECFMPRKYQFASGSTTSITKDKPRAGSGGEDAFLILILPAHSWHL